MSKNKKQALANSSPSAEDVSLSEEQDERDVSKQGLDASTNSGPNFLVPADDPFTISSHLRVLPHRGESYYMHLNPNQYALLLSLAASMADIYDVIIIELQKKESMELKMEDARDSGDPGAQMRPDNHLDFDILGKYFPSFEKQITDSYVTHFYSSALKFPFEAELAYRLLWFVCQLQDSEKSKWFSHFRKCAESLVEFDQSFPLPYSMTELIETFKMK